MGNSDGSKPFDKVSGQPAKPASVPASPPAAKSAGRVKHDARGNAVWDWVVESGRNLVDSTSRLLKRLDIPELKTEEQAEKELHVESDGDAGGGYDPYGRSGRRNATGDAAASRNPGGRTGKSGDGGGYDPYSKGAPRKPGR